MGAPLETEFETQEMETDIMMVDQVPPQPEDHGDNVIVPLYSKFRFQDVAIVRDEDTLEKVKEHLGPEWEHLVEEGDDGFVKIRDTPEIAGRGRLPKGATAAEMNLWKTMLVFPSSDRGEDQVICADEVDYSAREIVARSGRVVCIIPVTLSLAK